MQYSAKVMDHFLHPRNVGEIEGADGVGTVGNPVCGDLMTFTIKVKDNRLTDVKFKTFGCGAAIAVSSITSELAKGKTLEEALKITNKTVAQELGGLPKNKLHCSNLGADALHKAVEDYLVKKGKPTEAREAVQKPVEVEQKVKAEGDCKCPYCKSDVAKESPFCQVCSKEINIQ